MNTAVAQTNASDIDYINPVISSTKNVFEMMLEAKVARTGLQLKSDNTPAHEVSAVIGLAGMVQGTIVLSFSERVACSILNQLVGVTADQIDHEVCDAVGEVANMVAGGAKAQLAQYDLNLSIPNVVTGTGHVIHFPSNVMPICISFESDFGPFTIEVGFTRPTH